MFLAILKHQVTPTKKNHRNLGQAFHVDSRNRKVLWNHGTVGPDVLLGISPGAPNNGDFP